MQTYDIIRFYNDANSERRKLVMRGVSLEKAQEWCGSAKTRKHMKWFDGFASSDHAKYACQLKKPIYPQNYELTDLK